MHDKPVLAPLETLVANISDKVSAGKNPSLPYVGLEDIESGFPSLLGFSPASASVSTNAVFRQGDVLFGKLRPNLRKTVAAPFDGYCSTDILVLRALNGTDACFAAKVFESEVVVSAAIRTAIGTRMPRTSWAALRDTEVFAPPLPEQRFIAQILDTVDEAIRKTEQLITKLELVKQGLVQDLLTRGIGDNGELRDPERHPEQFKDSPLGRLPKGWKVSTVASEFGVTSGFTLNRGRVPNHHPWPYLRVANVYRDQLMLEDVAYLEVRESELVGRELQADDLLIVEGHANPCEIGRCGRATEKVEGFTFQNHLFRLRAHRLNATFAHLWLNSSWARSYWSKEAVSSSGLYTINQGKLALLRIACPPSNEQEQIGRLVESFDNRLESERHLLSKLRLLKSGLMDDLLTGRVRVTPLLERASE